MKTILLFRHGKSDWSDPYKADFDRPLAKRGRKDVPIMGKVLAFFNHAPDLILSSPAERARQTTEQAAKACGYKKPIQWEESFYGGGSGDLIAALQNLPNTVERPMLVGHNPALEETAAALLSASRNYEGYDDWAIRIPTAGLVCLEVDLTDWAALKPGDAVLRWFLIPRLVKAIK